ncbi:helix-turn-helix transcriptional regulator [Clostridium perfringens]|nr:helix-turn-helix transcriptional regulator [Clostridium perfringens]
MLCKKRCLIKKGVDNTINNKFSILLGKKLIKISEISRETGISRTTLTNIYYKKSTKISFDVLDKLCNYLECSISDIIEFEK